MDTITVTFNITETGFLYFTLKDHNGDFCGSRDISVIADAIERKGLAFLSECK